MVWNLVDIGIAGKGTQPLGGLRLKNVDAHGTPPSRDTRTAVTNLRSLMNGICTKLITIRRSPQPNPNPAVGYGEDQFLKLCNRRSDAAAMFRKIETRII